MFYSQFFLYFISLDVLQKHTHTQHPWLFIYIQYYRSVFVGADKITGEIVALKRINTEEEENGFPITAIREVKILKALNHENIVKLKEIVTSKGESPLPQSHSLMGLCCCDVYAMYIYLSLFIVHWRIYLFVYFQSCLTGYSQFNPPKTPPCATFCSASLYFCLY
jgi:serine/threonine protein kinase